MAKINPKNIQIMRKILKCNKFLKIGMTSGMKQFVLRIQKS